MAEFTLAQIQEIKKIASELDIYMRVPIGTIISFAGSYFLRDKSFEQNLIHQPELTVQEYERGIANAENLSQMGWLICDGRLNPINLQPTHPLFALATVIGETWGGSVSVNGIEYFRIPDLQGLFLRGVSSISLQDPDANTRIRLHPNDSFGNIGNAVGSFQKDIFKEHQHFLTAWTHQSDRNAATNTVGDNGHFTDGITYQLGTSKTGGQETRPKNAYVYYLIKASDKSINLEQLLSDSIMDINSSSTNA